jgi:hypothetical protein
MEQPAPAFDHTPERPAAPARPRDEVLENLLRSSQSIEINLQEIRKSIKNE